MTEVSVHPYRAVHDQIKRNDRAKANEVVPSIGASPVFSAADPWEVGTSALGYVPRYANSNRPVAEIRDTPELAVVSEVDARYRPRYGGFFAWHTRSGRPDYSPEALANQSGYPGYTVSARSWYSQPVEDRYQKNLSGQETWDSVNSYDGLPDSIGSWYLSGNTREFAQLSQTVQVGYPMMGYD